MDCDPSCQQHLHEQGLRPDLFKLSCSYRSKPVLWQSSADFGFILSRQGFALVYMELFWELGLAFCWCCTEPELSPSNLSQSSAAWKAVARVHSPPASWRRCFQKTSSVNTMSGKPRRRWLLPVQMSLSGTCPSEGADCTYCCKKLFSETLNVCWLWDTELSKSYVINSGFCLPRSLFIQVGLPLTRSRLKFNRLVSPKTCLPALCWSSKLHSQKQCWAYNILIVNREVIEEIWAKRQ